MPLANWITPIAPLCAHDMEDLQTVKMCKWCGVLSRFYPAHKHATQLPVCGIELVRLRVFVN